MISEIGVSSSSGFEIAEGSDGMGKDSGSAICNSSKGSHGLASNVGVICESLRSSSLACGAGVCKNDPLEAKLRYLEVFLFKSI